MLIMKYRRRLLIVYTKTIDELIEPRIGLTMDNFQSVYQKDSCLFHIIMVSSTLTVRIIRPRAGYLSFSL